MPTMLGATGLRLYVVWSCVWKPFRYDVWMVRNDIRKEFERINSRHNKSAKEEDELHRRVAEVAEKSDPLFKSRMSQLQLI